jgi:hypothetical protein
VAKLSVGEEMTEHDDSAQSQPYSRRKFLGEVAAVGAARLGAPLIGTVASAAASPETKGATLLGRAWKPFPPRDGYSEISDLTQLLCVTGLS